MKNKAKLIKFGLLIYTVGVVMVAILAQYNILGAAVQVNAECNLCFSGRTCNTPADWESGWYDGCFNRDTGDRNNQPDYDPNTGTVQNGNEGVNGYQPGDNINGAPGNQQNANDPSVNGNSGSAGGAPTAGNGQGQAYVGDSCNTDADCFGGLTCASCGGFGGGNKCVNGVSQTTVNIGCMQPGRNPTTAAANCDGLALWQIRCYNNGTTIGQQCSPNGLKEVRADACGASCSNGIIQAAGRSCSSTTVGGVTYNYVTHSGFLGCGDVVLGDAARACDNCYLNNGQVSCRFEGASCGAKVGCGVSSPATPIVSQAGPAVEYAGQSDTPPSTPPQTPPPPNPPCQAGCTPGISVDKAVMGGTNYTVGSLVTFSITITNTGDQTLNTVAFADNYAAAYLDFTGISGSRTGTGVVNLIAVANINEAAGTINFANLVPSLGALAPGQAYTLNVSFIARAPISITCNYVNVTTGGGPTGGDNACVGINTPDTDI
jgi:hypothetical protein